MMQSLHPQRPVERRHFTSPALGWLAAHGDARVLVSFAGQGQPFMHDLEELHRDDERARCLIEFCAQALADEFASHDDLVELRVEDLDLSKWLSHPDERPADAVLQAAPISYPLIFVAQAARLAALESLGFAPAGIGSWADAVTGHSQGIVAAWLAARGLGHHELLEEAARLTRFMYWVGARKQAAWGGHISSAPTMAEVSGLSTHGVFQLIQGFEGLVCQIRNSQRRHVVSGPSDQVERFCRHLDLWRRTDPTSRKVGTAPLPCTAPFHSPYLACAVDPLLSDAARLGVELVPDDLVVPLLHYEDGSEWQGSPCLIESLCMGALDWPTTLRAACDRGITHVVDLGPHDAMAKLAASLVEGYGVQVISAASAGGRTKLTTSRPAELSRPVPWSSRTPRLLTTSDGRKVSVNAFTRYAGRPPVLFCTFSQAHRHLAGNLQDHIDALLSPGLGRTFSAVCIDPELLDRSPRPAELRLDLRDAASSVFGVSVVVGPGQVDETLALLKALEGFRLRLCSLVVDDDVHLVKALTIADNLPDSTLILHVGGSRTDRKRAPEELEEILLRWYSRIRVRSNLLLAVHGSSEMLPRARDLLTGTWSAAHDFPPMPVDAVFLDAESLVAFGIEAPSSLDVLPTAVP